MLLFDGARVRARGAFLAGGSIGPDLCALALAAQAVSAPTAQHADGGHAGVHALGAVTVASVPVSIALAEAAVAYPVTY